MKAVKEFLDADPCNAYLFLFYWRKVYIEKTLSKVKKKCARAYAKDMKKTLKELVRYAKDCLRRA